MIDVEPSSKFLHPQSKKYSSFGIPMGCILIVQHHSHPGYRKEKKEIVLVCKDKVHKDIHKGGCGFVDTV